MKNRFATHIWTSDINMACLPATCYLFNKYWPSIEQVKIIGYKKPSFELPQNFEFISLGEQRGPRKWSDDMKNFYSNEKCSYFYSIWEDAFILKEVDKKIINLVNQLIEKDRKFFKFNMTADVSTRQHTVLRKFENFDLISADQDSRYRFSTQHCVWHKERFLDSIEPNQTPWDFELNDKKARFNGLNIYATKRKYAVYMGHLYKQGRKRNNWYDCVYGTNGNKTHDVEGLLKPEVEKLEKSGWVPEI